MGTVAAEITDPQEYLNPSVTKVVVDREGFALYFSKGPIPFYRVDGEAPPAGVPAWQHLGAPPPLKHLGLYVYRRETLLWLSGLEPTPLEQAEKLEQLRALERGCRIKVALTEYSPVSVDTPEDLQRVRALVAFCLARPSAGPSPQPSPRGGGTG
jgi:3-deoxy-manno-octulosonate cytidylyltransferase (CMP-KDO synthetase)